MQRVLGSNRYLALRFTRRVARERALDRWVNEMVRRCGGRERIVIAMGDHSRSPDSPIRGHPRAPGSVALLRRMLSKLNPTGSFVPDRNATLVCSRCGSRRRLEPAEGAANPYGSLCCATCGRCWQRDGNAARNIAAIGTCATAAVPKPELYGRRLPPRSTPAAPAPSAGAGRGRRRHAGCPLGCPQPLARGGAHRAPPSSAGESSASPAASSPTVSSSLGVSSPASHPLWSPDLASSPEGGQSAVGSAAGASPPAPPPDLMALLDGFAAPSPQRRASRRPARRSDATGPHESPGPQTSGPSAATPHARLRAAPALDEGLARGSSSPLLHWEVDAASPRSVASSSLAGTRPLTPDDVAGLSPAELASLDRDAAEAEQAARQSRREIARARRRERLRRGGQAAAQAWLLALGLPACLALALLPSRLASGLDAAVQRTLAVAFALVGATVGLSIGVLAALAALGAAAARAGRRVATARLAVGEAVGVEGKA